MAVTYGGYLILLEDNTILKQSITIVHVYLGVNTNGLFGISCVLVAVAVNNSLISPILDDVLVCG